MVSVYSFFMRKAFSIPLLLIFPILIVFNYLLSVYICSRGDFVGVKDDRIVFDPTRLKHGAADADGDFRDPALRGEIIRTEVVIFVPSPVEWESRRKFIYSQFRKEGWVREKAVLLFVFGNRTGNDLSGMVDVSSATRYSGAVNVVLNCMNTDERLKEPDDTAGMVCKLYKSLKYIHANYQANYVWRADSDSYINLIYFFNVVMPSLQRSRLFMGGLLNNNNVFDDSPLLKSLFGLTHPGYYMRGGGFLMSFDVVDFIASLKIPPHLTSHDDVMMGMWLRPFQITFLHTPLYIEQLDGVAQPGVDYLVIHRMQPEQWENIDSSGRLRILMDRSVILDRHNSFIKKSKRPF